LEAAKEIAMEMGINPEFTPKRKIKRKRHFDEVVDESADVSQSEEESFRVDYFIYVIDQAIVSLTKRFEQYKSMKILLVSCLLQIGCNPWIIRI
jgi:hypothetical protein